MHKTYNNANNAFTLIAPYEDYSCVGCYGSTPLSLEANALTLGHEGRW